MNSYDIIILTLFRHGFKARGNTLLHLLRGKRTTSVLMYGFLFQLLPYFGVFPRYKEASLENSLKKLSNLGYLHPLDENYQISHEGVIYLEKNKQIIPIYASLNNFRFNRIDTAYWELVLFVSQVVSELTYENSQYAPIEPSRLTQLKVKRWLGKQHLTKKELGEAFYREWTQLIDLYPEPVREHLIVLLTGHGQIGRTFQQAFPEEKDEVKRLLQGKDLLHLALTTILSSSENFPFFYDLFYLVTVQSTNQSAEETYSLFQQGKNVVEIEQIRQLKRSTISDHLIEMAIIDKKFETQRLISTEQCEALTTYKTSYGNYRNWRYKEVQDVFPCVDFLSFRMYQVVQVRGEEHG